MPPGMTHRTWNAGDVQVLDMGKGRARHIGGDWEGQVVWAGHLETAVLRPIQFQLANKKLNLSGHPGPPSGPNQPVLYP